MNISIITPVRAVDPQQVAWLGEAIESVLAQSAQNWEMHIVDDHSEVSLAELKPLFKDPRIHGYKSDGDGVSAARNYAAGKANFELLLPLDADDALPPNSLEMFLEAWDNGGGDRGIVYPDVEFIGQDRSRWYTPPNYGFDMLLKHTFMIVGCLHRKSDWERIGGWDESFQIGLEDWEYWIRMGANGVCGLHMNAVAYRYRRHAIGRLAKLKIDPDRQNRAYQMIREKHVELYNGRKPMGCCGDSIPSVMQPAQGVSRNIPVAMASLQNPVSMYYKGDRKGSFNMNGRVTGIIYRIPGKSFPPRPFPVDERDVPLLKQYASGTQFDEYVATTPSAPSSDVAASYTPTAAR